MENKKILLIGGNYFPEPTGIGKYNGEMMNWLAGQGHDCTVVTTYPYYPFWKVQAPYKRRSYWFKTEKIQVEENEIKIIRCPHYVPKNPTAVTRLISEFTFFFSAYLVVLALLFAKKFEYVVTVAPPFEIGLLGIFYKKIRGGKFLYHIQDLQVDAARDLEIIKSKSIINFFLSIEKFIIKHADSVSTISAGMIERVKDKCTKEVLLFPNWVDVEAFHPLTNKAVIKANYGFKTTDKIVLYSGAIGHKQGLEAVLESAKTLENHSDIKFAICGSGPYKERLIRLKDEMNLKNVFFLPLQPLSEFNSFLNMADVHLVLQKAGASDLVLPSKLSTILSVGGVAIVTANEGTSLYQIMTSTDMGIVIEPENKNALVAALIDFGNGDYEKKGRNARIFAERNLATNKILDEFFTKTFNGSIRNVKTVSKKYVTTVA